MTLIRATTLSMIAALLASCSQSASDMNTRQAEEAAPIAGASDTNPVVVEIYQSQGCSSCPPANANINRIAGDEGILALSFAVTYWDRLGWKDIFADAAYTDRQWDYARTGSRRSVFTPQVIVNGGEPIVGNDLSELRETIAQRGPLTGGPVIDPMGDRVVIGMAPASEPATAWLVRYDPESVEVDIGAGENTGRTLPHRNIVHQLEELGQWTGEEAIFDLPATPRENLKTAVLLQQGTGGPIVAARKF